MCGSQFLCLLCSQDTPTKETVWDLRRMTIAVPEHSSARSSPALRGGAPVSPALWAALMDRLLEWNGRTVRISVKGAARGPRSSNKVKRAHTVVTPNQYLGCPNSRAGV